MTYEDTKKELDRWVMVIKANQKSFIENIIHDKTPEILNVTFNGKFAMVEYEVGTEDDRDVYGFKQWVEIDKVIEFINENE